MTIFRHTGTQYFQYCTYNSVQVLFYLEMLWFEILQFCIYSI